MANRIYNEIGALRPGKSAFDLSHVRVFDTDIGRLTPVLLEDVIPGDIFEISQASLISSLYKLPTKCFAKALAIDVLPEDITPVI